MKRGPEPSLFRCDVTVRTGNLTPKNLKYVLSPLGGHIITLRNVWINIDSARNKVSRDARFDKVILQFVFLNLECKTVGLIKILY